MAVGRAKLMIARNTVLYALKLRLQTGKITLNRLPDDFQVDFVVTMRNAITHCVHDLPRDIAVLRSKLRGYAQDVIRRFANDLDVTDHGVLRKRSTAPPCQAPSYAMAGALIGSNSSIRL